MMYNNIVEDCFFQPRHVGSVSNGFPLSAHVHSQVAGQNRVLDLYLVCTQDKIITKACFKASGGPYLIAASEWVCRQIEGMPLSKLPCYSYTQLSEILAIPTAMYPVAIQVSQAYQELVRLMNRTFEE